MWRILEGVDSEQLVAPGRRRALQRGLRSGVAISVALALVQTACFLDERYPYFIVPGNEGAPGVERALLLPLDFPEGLGSYLPASAARLQAEVEAHLVRHGIELASLPRRSSSALVAALKGAQEGVADPTDQEAAMEHARSALSRTLASRQDVDAVILAEIRVRIGQVRNQRLAWDGVVRDIPLEGDGLRNIRRDSIVLRGKLEVFSLYVQVWTPDGRHLFESYAGLEPAVAIRAGDSGNVRFAGIRPRRTELTDLGIMRHAVALAFDPYLPATGSRRSASDSSP